MHELYRNPFTGSEHLKNIRLTAHKHVRFEREEREPLRKTQFAGEEKYWAREKNAQKCVMWREVVKLLPLE